MTKNRKPPLAVIGASEQTWGNPPRTLDEKGRALWDRVMAEYAIQDAGGIELLLLACEATDRIYALREEIEHDGAVIRSRNGAIKEHPALRAEIAAMAFVSRTLARLGLDVEPVRPTSGRPGQGTGWRPPA